MKECDVKEQGEKNKKNKKQNSFSEFGIRNPTIWPITFSYLCTRCDIGEKAGHFLIFATFSTHSFPCITFNYKEVDAYAIFILLVSVFFAHSISFLFSHCKLYQ